jgi:rhodanese-related sulfurtransferase
VNTVSGNSKTQQKSSGGYCGIYCLYGAMKALGVNVDPNDLMRPEYIGSVQGSSLAELKKAAEAHGLYARPVTHLTTRDLRGLSCPVILHIKSAPTKKRYDHYELFIGTRQGQALIYDPPAPAELSPFWTLAPRWDGSGLLISDKPIRLSTVFGPARRQFAVCTGIAAAIVLAARCGRRRLVGCLAAASRRQTLLLSLGQCTVLTLAAISCGFAYHYINDEGFIARRQATTWIQEAYQANFIPKIGDRQARRLLAEKNAVFVDPRPDYDFKTRHLKDSLNIPSYLTDNDRIKTMGQIDKKARIIVYCTDSTRRLADIVASRLLSDGFSNVMIYKGKWERLINNT